MFKIKSKVTDDELEKAIASVYKELEVLTADQDEYDKTLDRLERLYALRPDEKGSALNVDTAVTVGANLLGIVAILGFERAHVVTSKALGFILKPKI